jgi:chromosome segregation ATPase
MARSRKTPQKHVVSRLSDKGEETLQRLGDLPGGKSMLKAMGDARERLDELSKKLRSIDPLERRVASLEKRLSALEKPKAKATTTRRTTTARKPATRAKPKSGSDSS